jgi:hypothetical protein
MPVTAGRIYETPYSLVELEVSHPCPLTRKTRCSGQCGLVRCASAGTWGQQSERVGAGSE